MIFSSTYSPPLPFFPNRIEFPRIIIIIKYIYVILRNINNNKKKFFSQRIKFQISVFFFFFFVVDFTFGCLKIYANFPPLFLFFLPQQKSVRKTVLFFFLQQTKRGDETKNKNKSLNLLFPNLQAQKFLNGTHKTGNYDI